MNCCGGRNNSPSGDSFFYALNSAEAREFNKEKEIVYFEGHLLHSKFIDEDFRRKVFNIIAASTATANDLLGESNFQTLRRHVLDTAACAAPKEQRMFFFYKLSFHQHVSPEVFLKRLSPMLRVALEWKFRKENDEEYHVEDELLPGEEYDVESVVFEKHHLPNSSPSMLSIYRNSVFDIIANKIISDYGNSFSEKCLQTLSRFLTGEYLSEGRTESTMRFNYDLHFLQHISPDSFLRCLSEITRDEFISKIVKKM